MIPARASTVVAGVSIVTAGSMAANIASYLLHLPAGRVLGPQGYGVFASLLAAQLVLAVPALALQTVVARDRVRGRSVAASRRLGHLYAVVVAGLAVVATPVVAALLHTDVVTTAAAVVTAPFLVLLATEQGLLQGDSRFGALGGVLAASGLAKVVPAVTTLVLGGGVGPALVAGALGTAGMALAARIVVDRAEQTDEHDRPAAAGTWRDVLAASQVQLVIVALSSVDLLLARRVLDPEAAGVYALGAVAAKAAFWLPQSVGVVLYPRMADPRQSASAVRTALLVLLGVGSLVVLGAAAVGPIVPLVMGADYAPVQFLLWLFAAQGALLAVVQCGLLAAVARGDTRSALAAWTVLVVEAVLVLTLVDTATELVVVAAACAAVASVVVSTSALGRGRVLGSVDDRIRGVGP